MFICQCENCTNYQEKMCKKLKKYIDEITQCPQKKEMKSHKVIVEELLTKEITVYCTDEEEIDKIIKDAYCKEEITLTADDFNNTVLCSIDDSDFFDL